MFITHKGRLQHIKGKEDESESPEWGDKSRELTTLLVLAQLPISATGVQFGEKLGIDEFMQHIVDR